MVSILMGLKGSGKTKRLVELVREAVKEETGDVVCIEKERKLTYDIPYQARLIEAGAYDIGSYEFLKGLICGIHAGNYDITHFFIDNFYKLVNDKSPEAFAAFIAWLDCAVGHLRSRGSSGIPQAVSHLIRLLCTLPPLRLFRHFP